MNNKFRIVIIAMFLIIGVLSGCTDLDVPDIPDEVTKKMTIVSFTVTPSIIQVGGTSNLSWVVTGSDTTVTIDNGIGSVSLTGSRIISPTETTTYKLTATNGTSTKNVTTQIIVNEETQGEETQTSKTMSAIYDSKDETDYYVVFKVTSAESGISWSGISASWSNGSTETIKNSDNTAPLTGDVQAGDYFSVYLGGCGAYDIDLIYEENIIWTCPTVSLGC